MFCGLNEKKKKKITALYPILKIWSQKFGVSNFHFHFCSVYNPLLFLHYLQKMHGIKDGLWYIYRYFSYLGMSLSSEDPRLFLTASTDEIVKIWDITEDRPSVVLSSNTRIVSFSDFKCHNFPLQLDSMF